MNSRHHHRRTTRSRPAWRWQAVMVFGPLLVLAALGGWGIRENRIAAKRHALRAVEATVPLIEQLARDETARLYQSTEPLNVLLREWPVPENPGEAVALYQKALAAEPAEAGPLLAKIERDYRDATTGSGLPLLPLVKWAQLQLKSLPTQRQDAAEALAMTAVRTHPSALTSELLSRASALLDQWDVEAANLSGWQAIRAEHERALEIWNAETHRDPGKSDEWLPRSAPEWHFHVVGGGQMLALSPERLRAASARVAASAQILLPDYFQVDVTGMKGHTLLAAAPIGERYFERAAGIFRLAWVLTDETKLHAEQMRQSLWLGAILVAALFTASTGFLAMRRSLSQERQLSEMKSNFVSSVSHELRAPLASMRLLAENLESGVVTDDARRAEYHSLIADECRRLGTLVDNVLDFARIEQGRKTYHFSEVDIAALVADTLRLLAPAATRRGQKFASEIEPLSPRCDGLSIQQALVNLVDNALKFSPPNSTVTVRAAKRSAQEWELSVRDEGPGVPLHEREKIFERFYRIGSELTRETQGAGIGLSIVKHIAEGHGGHVTVDGSTFTLVLPCAPPVDT